MHIYLRIIHDAWPESYSAAEQQQLRDCLGAAPGIETIKELKQHPRGGYSVTMDRKDDNTDVLISHITSHGYRVVI
jgi:hypothetical protein